MRGLNYAQVRLTERIFGRAAICEGLSGRDAPWPYRDHQQSALVSRPFASHVQMGDVA